MDFQIVLSSILHFTNNFIHNHAIQSSILYSQFWPSMPQSISTAYTLQGNPRENFLIEKILVTKAILRNVLVLSQNEAPFFLFFHQLFAFYSYFLLFDIKCSPPRRSFENGYSNIGKLYVENMSSIPILISEGFRHIFSDISINSSKLHFQSWRKNFSNSLALFRKMTDKV